MFFLPVCNTYTIMNNKELDIFVENIYRLKHKLFKTLVLMYLDYEAHVPDLMTRIRSLPGFAVVGQSEKVERSQSGGARLLLTIKYLPRTEDVYSNIDEMASQVKKLPGVKSIKVLEYNKRPILKNGKPLMY